MELKSNSKSKSEQRLSSPTPDTSYHTISIELTTARAKGILTATASPRVNEWGRQDMKKRNTRKKHMSTMLVMSPEAGCRHWERTAKHTIKTRRRKREVSERRREQMEAKAIIKHRCMIRMRSMCMCGDVPIFAPSTMGHVMMPRSKPVSMLRRNRGERDCSMRLFDADMAAWLCITSQKRR